MSESRASSSQLGSASCRKNHFLIFDWIILPFRVYIYFNREKRATERETIIIRSLQASRQIWDGLERYCCLIDWNRFVLNNHFFCLSGCLFLIARAWNTSMQLSCISLSLSLARALNLPISVAVSFYCFTLTWADELVELLVEQRHLLASCFSSAITGSTNLDAPQFPMLGIGKGKKKQ